MTRRQLIPLLVIVLVLAVVVFVQKSSLPVHDLRAELGAVALAPQDLNARDVSRVEMYRGSKKDKEIAIGREGDGWIVESRFNAPGNADKIKTLLTSVLTVQGELRSETAKVIGEYGLADDDAVHIVLSTRKSDKEAERYHLLTGKKEGDTGCFVRKEGENAVYTAPLNISSELGLWSDDAGKAPDSSPWVDKKILGVEKDEVTRVALTTPDRAVVFEKREKPAPAPKGGEKKETAKKGEDQAEKSAKKEYEWVVAAGAQGLTFLPSGMEGFLSAIGSYEADDIENPAKKKELGLESPGFRCEIDCGKDRKVTLLASRGKAGGQNYAMVEGRPGLLYVIPDWKFEELFRHGNELFELPRLSESADNVTGVRLTAPTYNLELVRSGEGNKKSWNLKSTPEGLRFRETAGPDVAAAFAAVKPIDYADGGQMARFGLDKPERVAAVSLLDGKERVLKIGAEAGGARGRYALFDNSGQLLIISAGDVDKTVPPLKNLLDLTVRRVDAGKIQRISVERDRDAFVLERKGDGWKLVAGGKDFDADPRKVQTYLARFAVITATDASLRPADFPAKTAARVSIKTNDAAEVAIEYGGEKDGQVAARVAGVSAALYFPTAMRDALTPASKDLCKEAVTPSVGGTPGDLTRGASAPGGQAPAPAPPVQKGPASK